MKVKLNIEINLDSLMDQYFSKNKMPTTEFNIDYTEYKTSNQFDTIKHEIELIKIYSTLL